ncbi:hypothetical protein NZ02_20400 [Xanthomonas phaseoli pv. phaseoli]|nr:hypothetical protein NZ02_20400 [Xanthomonas phaseoli pv. phaseoli]
MKTSVLQLQSLIKMDVLQQEACISERELQLRIFSARSETFAHQRTTGNVELFTLRAPSQSFRGINYMYLIFGHAPIKFQIFLRPALI